MNEQKRILVVDDDPKVLFILSTALGTLGAEFEVATAHSGRDALTRIEEVHFDLERLTKPRVCDTLGVWRNNW